MPATSAHQSHRDGMTHRNHMFMNLAAASVGLTCSVLMTVALSLFEWGEVGNASVGLFKSTKPIVGDSVLEAVGITTFVACVTGTLLLLIGVAMSILAACAHFPRSQMKFARHAASLYGIGSVLNVLGMLLWVISFFIVATCPPAEFDDCVELEEGSWLAILACLPCPLLVPLAGCAALSWGRHHRAQKNIGTKATPRQTANMGSHSKNHDSEKMTRSGGGMMDTRSPSRDAIVVPPTTQDDEYMQGERNSPSTPVQTLYFTGSPPQRPGHTATA